MDLATTTRKRRVLASVSLGAVALVLFLATRRVESIVTVVLPALVIHWMISSERRFATIDPDLPNVPLITRVALFVFLPGLSLAVITFWFPIYAKNWNTWGIYAVGSFSLALLLVKLYERFLLIRRRLKGDAAPGRA